VRRGDVYGRIRVAGALLVQAPAWIFALSQPAASIIGLNKPFWGRSIETLSVDRPLGFLPLRPGERLHGAIQVAEVVVPVDRGRSREVGVAERLGVFDRDRERILVRKRQ